MVQVYIATAVAFALMGIMAYLEELGEERASWYIIRNENGSLIGGEFIEE